MAYTRDSGTQNKRVKRVKKPVRMTPHSPGGQRLRPAPVSHPKPRTPAAKRQGVRVIQRAATPKQNTPYGPGGQRVHSVPVTPHKPRTKAEKKQGVKVIQKAAHVHPKKHGSGLFNFAASTLASSIPGPVGAIEKAVAPKAGKILENMGREAITIPENIVPSFVHIAKPAYQHPKSPKAYLKSGERLGDAVISLPKEYVKAYQKKGLKGAEDVLVKHPLSTALTVAPIPRGPGLIAGRIARRSGTGLVTKHIPAMPKIEPRTLPGTNLKENIPRSRSYFKAKRQAKKGGGEITPKQGVFASPIERRIDEHVGKTEDLARRKQAATFRKAYKGQGYGIKNRLVKRTKPSVKKAEAQQLAAGLAKKAQEKVRVEQGRQIENEMGLLEKPKYVASGNAKTSLKEARAKEKAARKALVKLPFVQGQLLRNTGHTIADYTKLEDAETRLFTLMEHHQAEAENARALGNDALEKQHQRMADTASKQLTPIEGELEKLHRVFVNSKGNPGAQQLEADLKHSDYVNARRERQAIESNPSNLRMVQPASNKVQIFPEATQALRAAERYNANHVVKMAPKRTKGGYVVMPETAIKRLKAHENVTDTTAVGAAAKLYNQLWRKGVLATHPTWYVGNVGEGGLRAAVERVGPFSFYRGHAISKAMKRGPSGAFDNLAAQTFKGGHMQMQARLPEETNLHITGEGKVANSARYIQKFRQAPPIRQVADGYGHITDLLMGTLSGGIESGIQKGMLGRALQDHPLMDGDAWKTSKAAIEDAANGLHETHNIVELGRIVDKMYGKYGKFSPTMRRVIANYTPFIAWTLNSLNWLYHTLPADHPVLTASVASAQPYVEQWIKDKKLSPFVKGALPSFLQGSIPTKHGFARFPTRYTPFAVAAGYPESLASSLLPQLESTINIWAHEINWKGQKLKNPDGSPLDPHQLFILGLINLAQGAIPAAQQFVDPASRYEKGARLSGKLVQPRSKKEIEKAFNPFTTVSSAKSSSSKKHNSLLDTGPSRKQKSLLDSPAKSDVKSLLDSP